VRNKVRRAALVVATVAAVAGYAPAAMAAPVSAGPSWHIVKRVSAGLNGGFTVVTAAGRNGGWAFEGHARSTAWERNGSTWTKVPFPSRSNEVVIATAASSLTNAWAFAEDGSASRALRWDGRHWTVVRSFSRVIGGGVVLSPSDVWVFGVPDVPGDDLGAWHYDGRTWSQVASGHGLEGGSGLSASDIWAFDGADVAHWNGSTWTRTSLAALLPAKQQLNDPALTGIYEQSPDSVYAIANGQRQDEGGPFVLLHWNGSEWAAVAAGSFGFGQLQQVTSDGHGGLWIPMPGFAGQKSYLLHYWDGHLTRAALPGGPNKITVTSVALIPGTTQVLSVGATHAPADQGTDVVGVVLQYEP
jgi:hypothetical protein